MDSGASQVYFAPDAPVTNFYPSEPPVHVGTATGSVQRSRGTYDLSLPILPIDIPKSGQVIPYFSHTLVGIGRFCDANFTVTFDKDTVIISEPADRPIIAVWRNIKRARMWRISLVHEEDLDPPIVPGEDANQAPIDAFSAYDLPSV